MVQIWTKTQTPSWSQLKAEIGMGSIVSSPIRVWGGAQDADDFSGF